MPNQRRSQWTSRRGSVTSEDQPSPVAVAVAAEPDTDAAIELEPLTLQQPLSTTAEQDDGTDTEPAPQPPAGRTGNAAILIEYPSLPSSTATSTIANGE